jgi:RHS repeat-associated protein
VFVGRAGGSRPGPANVAVTVASHSVAQRLGITGVVFRVAAARGSGPVLAGIDYASFADAYGGNYGSRLQLIELPGCALSTARPGGCMSQRVVPGAENLAGLDELAGTVMVPAGRQGVVLAATSTTYTTNNGNGGGDGGGTYGSYTATTLKPSGNWSVGGSTGDFTYSYPVTVPPAPSGMVPTISLDYDSGTLDGQTAGAQTQSGWLGDGWSTPDNYIEQTFVPCPDDPEGSAPTNTHSPTQDNCYDGQVLTLSLNGQSTSLVDDNGRYVLADDNGDTVQQATSHSGPAGLHDPAYWIVTDRSGRKYYFGLNHLPGWKSGDRATNSVDFEPVYSSHPGDPCYKSSWSGSACTMAYRWHLDYVTDAHGNAMAWYYDQAANYYVQDAAKTYTTKPHANAGYIRDSYLDHIDYGFTDGSAYTVNGGHAPDQIVFSTASRCDLKKSCPPISKTPSDYPDVPWDINCDNGAQCLVSSPSFWSAVRLAGITARQWNGTGWRIVDGWTFTQAFPPTGDGEKPTLFLSSITRDGEDTSTGGPARSLPAVTFTSIPLQNRFNPSGRLPAMTRARISSIATESGAVITVDYENASACTAADRSKPVQNTGSCFPQWWTPAGAVKPVLDWFNSWQVKYVTTADTSDAGNAELYTGYQYLGGAAWHYDDSEGVKPGYRTYSQYRGFGEVRTITGQHPDTPTVTQATYFRGMSDDNNAVAVTLKDSQGGRHLDADQLTGQPLEVTQCGYDASCTTGITGSTIYSYWVSAAAATRLRKSQHLLPLTANAAGQVETWTRQALRSRSGPTVWRRTETDTSYYAAPSDPYFGLPQYSYAHGDLPLRGNNQVRCTITSYAPPDTADNIAGLVAQTETDAVPCGGHSPDGASAPSPSQINALQAPASVSRPADVVSDTCTVYDDKTLASAWSQATSSGCPASHVTEGDVSEVLQANGYTDGTFTYQPRHSAVYDGIGRVTESWDGNGNPTKTSYTTSRYGLTTGVKTINPLGQTSSTVLDPERGLTVSSTDINGITIVTHYDGLGRVISEWDHSRYTPKNPPLPDATFDYFTPTLAPAPPPRKPPVMNQQTWAVTTNVLNDALGYASSTTVYDSLSRVRQTQEPTPQSGSLATDTFYNSLGQVWKTNNKWAAPELPGTVVIPVRDADVPDQTVTAYDGQGRPVLVTNYGYGHIRSQTATEYDQAVGSDGDATITVPLGASTQIYSGHTFTGGTATATVTDALGRTSQLDQYTTLPAVAVSKTTPVTVKITGGTAQATFYSWDNTEHEAVTTDQATGEAWVSDSNLLSQVTRRTDPDAGTTTMAYDGDGNLVQTTDANGHTLSWTYDRLSRKTAEYDAPAKSRSPANELASWAYDNSNDAVPGMTRPNGELTTATRYIDSNVPGHGTYVDQATGFDVFGHQTGQTITLHDTGDGALDTSYHFGYTATSIAGDPVFQTYPASPGAGALPAETVTTGYADGNGIELPIGLAGLNSYTAQINYNAYWQVQQELIGSLTVQAAVSNTWDENTGLLTGTNVKTFDILPPVDNTRYTYDPAGNPLSQTETRALVSAAGKVTTETETQCFGYDTLARLAQAWTAAGKCAASPSTATVGDGIPGGAYWTSWTYSPLGLRTSQTSHGLDGAATATTSYRYNGDGARQPDTLTSTITKGAGSSAYTYDHDGNLTTRTITTGSAATGQKLSWNDDGTLAGVTGKSGGSSYVYDADGDLVLERDPGTTTLYLPGEQLTLNTATHTIGGTRYYPMPGEGMAVRTGTTSSSGKTSTSYFFEFTDQHDTGTLILDPDLKARSAVWRMYTPFGGRRGPAVSWPDNHGFLNKPVDTATGLISMGARWYDPSTGTFESLDPVFEAISPQQHNGYAYAADNPETNSDPTGQLITGGGGGSCAPNAHGCGGNVGSSGGIPQGGTTSYGTPPPSSYAGCQPGIPGCPGWSAALAIVKPAAMPQYATFAANFANGLHLSAGTPAYAFYLLYSFCAQYSEENSCGGGSNIGQVGRAFEQMLADQGEPLAGRDGLGMAALDTGNSETEDAARGYEQGDAVAAEQNALAQTDLEAWAAEGDVNLYRGMRGTEEGSPDLGPSASKLGARPGIDIPVDENGMVRPGTGGMSVNESPMGMPEFRRPPSFGGSGKNLNMYCVSSCDLGANLQYVPESGGHGFLEPASEMSFAEYQQYLYQTQGSWSEVLP